MEEQKNLWNETYLFFKDRMSGPFKSPAFVFYFIFVILIIGALGIHCAWMFSEFPKSQEEHIISNMNCYFLTLVSTSALGLLLMNHETLAKTIRMLYFGIIVISIIIFVFSTIQKSYLLAIIGTILSLLIWWLANAENKDILDDSYYGKMRNKSNDLSKNW